MHQGERPYKVLYAQKAEWMESSADESENNLV
jgi:hypothetical protein